MTFAPSFFRLAVDSFRVAGVIVSFFWYSGGYSVGDPPLPIPNREVKPSGADGTAFPRGTGFFNNKSFKQQVNLDVPCG